MTLLESFPFSHAEYISSGIDSQIFRWAKHIAKIYKEADIKTVENYRDITNKAADYLFKNPLVCSLRSRDNYLDSHIGIYRVVPILEVGDHRGKTVAISEYVPGPTLHTIHWAMDDKWKSEMDGLDPAEKENLEQFFTTYRKWGTSMYPSLGDVSDQLAFIANADGIHIDDVNLKVRFDTDHSINEYIITDLAFQLDRIKVITE